MHPAFRDEFRSDAEIQRDVDERKKEVAARRWANPIYPVKPVLSERCAVEHLIQVMGRTLRVDIAHPNRKKCVILFCELDNQSLFEKECKKQNGAKVIPFQFNTLARQSDFLKVLGKAIPSLFKPFLFERIFETLDSELTVAPKVKLGNFASRMKDTYRIYSHKTIEDEIRKLYLVDLLPIGNHGKMIAVITGKNDSVEI